MLLERVAGLLVEPIGSDWAAYSPASGETTLLNDESAAILEVLSLGAATREQIYHLLAEDAGLPAAEVATILGPVWQSLLDAGLIRPIRPSADPSEVAVP